MSSSESIIFYDIASGAPLRTFAPNPWKARYALNFKKVAYRTEPVQMPDISSVREKLGVPANRTLPNGKPYHTLPVIQDPSTGKVIGDSFEIALYLDKTYTENTLIRPNTTGLTAAFNAQVDSLFTKYALFFENMPFDPAIAGKIGEIFAERMSTTAFANMQPSDEDKEKMLIQFENSLGELVKAYYHVGGTTDHVWLPTGTAAEQAQTKGREVSVFLEDGGPMYADFIVGAWLAAMESSMKPENWQRLRTWQAGFWGRLHDALAPWREYK